MLLNLTKDMLLMCQRGEMTEQGNNVFEEAILFALEIMQKIPPNELPSIAGQYNNGQLHDLMDAFPIASLLQENHYNIRTNENISVPSLSASHLSLPSMNARYPEAVIASGLSRTCKKQLMIRKRWMQRCALVVLTTILATVASFHNLRRHVLPMSSDLRGERQYQNRQLLNDDLSENNSFSKIYLDYA